VPALDPAHADRRQAGLSHRERFFLPFHHVERVGRMQRGPQRGEREIEPHARMLGLQVLDRALRRLTRREDFDAHVVHPSAPRVREWDEVRAHHPSRIEAEQAWDAIGRDAPDLLHPERRVSQAALLEVGAMLGGEGAIMDGGEREGERRVCHATRPSSRSQFIAQ
jgi:hypothetical protein